MPVGISEGCRVVLRVTVKVQTLRVPKVRIRYRRRFRRPIRNHETPYGAGVKTRSEVVQPTFGVAFFAGELVVLWSRVAEYSLSAIGVVVGFVLDVPAAVGQDRSRSQMV